MCKIELAMKTITAERRIGIQSESIETIRTSSLSFSNAYRFIDKPYAKQFKGYYTSIVPASDKNGGGLCQFSVLAELW